MAVRRTVLLLHDDIATREMVRAVLAADDADVVAVESAYRTLAAPPASPPDVVLLGLTAVDDRDVELVAILRRQWPHARTILLFPASLRERAARALALGADGYLPEPFYAGELRAFVRLGCLDTAPALAPAAPPAREAPTAPLQALPAPTDTARAVEQLAAGVAHSIRNPLQILELQLGAVETDGETDVAGMREQLRRIATVVEGLTRFAGHRNVPMRPLDVNQIVAKVFGGRRDTPAGQRVQFVPSPERAEVVGAADLLRAAFETLRARAERVTPPSGSIDVRVSVAPRDEPTVEVSVTDSGPALTEPQRARIFQPYPDADSVQDGTGLELAAAAGIVRDHGGSTEALPAANMGTTLVVRLPARNREETPAAGAGESKGINR